VTARPAAARGAGISQIITWCARLTAAGARAAAAASITTGKGQS
jgi:hypothetical protein